MSKLKSKPTSKKSASKELTKKIEVDLDTYEYLKQSLELYENKINRLEIELKK